MIINPYIFGGFDPDAQAFITAASITNTTQQNAINTLVVDLKGYGVWTKMKAIYPFVGGTATSHSYNLKNTAQYQITWFGGVTHDANGITGNGTNGYGDTFLNGNILGQNNAHISIYSRTNIASSGNDLGLWDSGFGSAIYSRNIGNNFQFAINSATTVNISNTSSLGLFLLSRLSSTQITAQINTTQNLVNLNSNIPKTTSYKLLRTGQANSEYSPRNLAFSSIGDGLTNTEATNLYTAVQAYQTSLSRQV
jgi:hypothetical protein